MDRESQKKFFEEAYNLGEKRIEAGYGWPMDVDTELKNFLEKIQETLQSGKVLDLGCGQGRHSIYCAEKGFEAYGIDYIERAIKEAKEKAEEKNLKNVHFKIGDVLNLNFPDNFFDIIIDWSVLDHIKFTDWDLYLKNVLKVLKIGGHLMLSEFSANDPRINEDTRHLYEHEKKPYPNSLYFEKEKYIDYYFSEEEIRDLFSKNFDIISINETTLETPMKSRPPHLMINVLMKRKA